MDVNKAELVFAMLIEGFLLLYYTNSALEYRYSRLHSNSILVVGYVIYSFVCVIFEISLINLIGFLVVVAAAFFLGFKGSFWGSIFKAFLFMAFMMIGELTAAVVVNGSFSNNFSQNITFAQAVCFTAVSKLIFFICTVLLKRLDLDKKHQCSSLKDLILLTILPASTCLLLYIFSNVTSTPSYSESLYLVAISVILLITNFIVYIVYDLLADKRLKIEQLQSIARKKETDYNSYRLVCEKYDELKIMVHDFNKYCSNIESLIGENNSEALAQLKSLKNMNKEFLLVEYTKNRALNVILSQKMAKCNKLGLDFKVYAQDIDISFISEADTVAIFANLLDNAIESAEKSKDKKIILNIYIVNNAYVVIKTENSCDSAPKIESGKLITSKTDRKLHGIGMTSIERTLKSYGGSMRWSYDSEHHTFTNMILIDLP